MIDDFRLWGSRWRRQTNTFLSEGGALAVVVQDIPQTPHWTRYNRVVAPPMRQGDATLRLACSPFVRRVGAPWEAGTAGPVRNA